MTSVGIGSCTALIIAAFGIRTSLLSTMDIQYDEIFHYTAQVSTSENLLASERKDIETYIQESPDITDHVPCRMNAVTAEENGYSTTCYLMTIPADRIDTFVTLRTYGDKEPIALNDEGIVIGQKLSELLNVGPGDSIVIDGDTRATVPVAAVNEHYLGHFAYMTPGCYEKVFGKSCQDNSYLLKLSDDSADLCNAVFTDMMDLHGVLAASRTLSTRDTYMKSMEQVDFVIVIVILSAAALALVVLYNLSNINITERRRELATIRVLGFYDREMSDYVNRENGVLTILGILFGIVAGHFLHVWLVKSVEIDLMMFGRTTDPWAYVWSALLTSVFSALVALLAHRKMKRIDMVESLKSAE